jgi:AcrR family transcriptional regulator
MSLQVTFHQPAPESISDMRTRKKARTRLAIQDAALHLFAEQGYEETSVEQIALRADVSASTFFRYFGTKADIILNEHDSQLWQLCAAVRNQSKDVPDVEAVRRALQAAWVPHVDPVRTIRTERAVARSAFLCGVAYKIGRRWMDAVAGALVERRGDPGALDECLLIARTALGVFGGATEHWASSEAKEDFGALVDQGFEMLERMCRN